MAYPVGIASVVGMILQTSENQTDRYGGGTASSWQPSRDISVSLHTVTLPLLFNPD
jgi:hypothetical protein